MGTITEGLKRILRREGLNAHRKGGKKLEEEIRRKKKTKRSEMKKEEKSIIYKIKCKDCKKLHTGHTKFNLDKRLKRQMKDVQKKKMQ